MRDDAARGRRNDGSTPGTAYWRSLEELGKQAAAKASPEFPDGCDLPPDAVSRRDMLGLMAASLGLAGLTGCRRPVEHIVPYVHAPEGIIPGIPQHYATTMPLGTSALGLVVESHEGRPTKVEGNELHPSSRGAAGTWAQAAILDLYDPDRSPRPRRRAAPAAAATGGGGEAAAGAESGQAGVEGGATAVAGEGEAAAQGTVVVADGEAEARLAAVAAAEAGNATWDEFAAFWAERAAAAGDGVGLAFLSAGYSSPTRARLSRALRERFPRARWAVWEPVHDGNVFAGVERATGRAQRPVYRLERARAVLALDCDLLGTESEAVANARGWVAGRRVAPIEHADANGHGARANGHGAQGEPGGAADGMSRLYAVESTMTLTGAAADHRLRLPSRLAGAFLAAVAGELGVDAGGLDGAGELPAAARARAAVIARDLAANPGAALVAVGRAQPPAVHALAHRVNQALGAVGATVTLHPLDDAEWGTAGAVVELAAALRDGEVSTLAILGANPAYDAPADAGFAEALAKVEYTVHLGDREDETARLCAWRLPESHFLEAWGDARAADGTPSVVQPLIAPLYDSRSAIEILALLAGGEPRSSHDLVRETWRDRLGVGDAAAWRRVLHDGLLAAGTGGVLNAGAAPTVAGGGSSAPPDAATAAELAGAPYELTFSPSLAVFDGRFANNGWLQELPDPITKLTWDNAALISGGTAADLGVTTGDVIALEAGGRTVEAPVFILPGQADGSIALALGYGRTAAGRVGTGRGVDAYPLRTSAGLGSTRVAATRTGRRYPLTQTQEHWTLDEPITGHKRSLVQEATLERYREDPHFAHEEHPEVELFPERVYDSGHQWGMVVDLNACTGCSACVVACQSENNIPIVGKEQVATNREMHWLRIDRYFSSPAKTPVRMADDPGVAFQPMPCQHCENAPCEQVCPVAATVHDSEGLNAMVYNRCIGTRYCSNNCPYKVRRFNFFNYTKDTPELVKLAMNPDVTVRSRGVMEKCTYCVQRINEAKIAAKRADRPLVDGDVRTACQQTCPTGAIVFGDLLAEGSRVAAAKRIDRNYTLLAGLHNKPRTSYLARLRNPNPAWEEGA
jgi:molybdopterin-containing oxidoreductase family iron-sulfur binding subunit